MQVQNRRYKIGGKIPIGFTRNRCGGEHKLSKTNNREHRCTLDIVNQLVDNGREAVAYGLGVDHPGNRLPSVKPREKAASF
mgnify:CR=1 FL=1